MKSISSILITLLLTINSHASDALNRRYLELSYSHPNDLKHIITEKIILTRTDDIFMPLPDEKSMSSACTGTYEVKEKNLHVQFDGYGGPGTGGGCHNLSFSLETMGTDVSTMDIGAKVDVVFLSIRFFRHPIKASLVRTY